MVKIILVLSVLGQSTVQDVRKSLNRFDELESITIESKTKFSALEHKDKPNSIRRDQVKFVTMEFIKNQLNKKPPFLEAEMAMFDNLIEDACKIYDKKDQPANTKAWYDTRIGRVWGWMDDKGSILYFKDEQPKVYNKWTKE